MRTFFRTSFNARVSASNSKRTPPASVMGALGVSECEPPCTGSGLTFWLHTVSLPHLSLRPRCQAAQASGSGLTTSHILLADAGLLNTDAELLDTDSDLWTTTAQAFRLLFSSSQLMPASLFSCTDTRQNNLITRLCFICYTVHNFCCFLPAWYSQNTCRHRHNSGRLEQIYKLELLCLGQVWRIILNSYLPDNIEGPCKGSKTQYDGKYFKIEQIFPVKSSRNVSEAKDQSRQHIDSLEKKLKTRLNRRFNDQG